MTQRDEAWRKAKHGKISASMFRIVLSDPNTKGYRNYYDQLVDQRLGIIDLADMDEKPWFQHGRDNEDAGIATYALRMEMSGAGQYTVEAHPDFIIHPDHPNIGCSPDCLVHGGELGGMELKCVSEEAQDNQKKLFQKGVVPSTHLPQIYGCMWITGAIWWDFGSYCPYVEEKYQLYVRRVYPDKNYFNRLEHACLKLDKEVKKTVKRMIKLTA